MKKLMLTDKELDALIEGLWNINALNYGESITVIVKYDSQLTLNEIDDYVIDSGGIY